MPRSSSGIPSSSKRRPAASRSAVPPVVGTLTRCWSGSMRGLRPRPLRAAQLRDRGRPGSSPGLRACRRPAAPSAARHVPSAITLPVSMTTIRCASRSASSMYCVVSRTVVPSATSSSMNRHRSLRVRGSRPVVGSSRKSTAGRAMRLAPMSSRRRIPPEYVFTSLSPASVSANRSSTSLGAAAVLALVEVVPEPDKLEVLPPGEQLVDRGVLAGEPDRRPQPAASATTSKPATRARPLSGPSSVVRIRTSVVLPAPFGPSSASTLPVSADRSTPASACVVPKRFATASTSIAASTTMISSADGDRNLLRAQVHLARSQSHVPRQGRGLAAAMTGAVAGAGVSARAPRWR